MLGGALRLFAVLAIARSCVPMTQRYVASDEDKVLAREGMRIVTRVRAPTTMAERHEEAVSTVQRETVRRNGATCIVYSSSPLSRALMTVHLQRLSWHVMDPPSLIDVPVAARRNRPDAPLACILVDGFTDEHPSEVIDLIRGSGIATPVILLTHRRLDAAQGIRLVPQWVSQRDVAGVNGGHVSRGLVSQEEGYDLGFNIVYDKAFDVTVARDLTELFLVSAVRSQATQHAMSNHLRIRTTLSDVTDRYYDRESHPEHFAKMAADIDAKQKRVYDDITSTTAADRRERRSPTPEPDNIDTHPTFVILQGKYEHVQQMLFATQKELAARNFQMSELETKHTRVMEDHHELLREYDSLKETIDRNYTNEHMAKERLEMMQRRAIDTSRIKGMETVIRNLRSKLDSADKTAEQRLATIESLTADVNTANERYKKEHAALEATISRMSTMRSEEEQLVAAEQARVHMELRYRRRETKALHAYAESLRRRLEALERATMAAHDTDADGVRGPLPSVRTTSADLSPVYVSKGRRSAHGMSFSAAASDYKHSQVLSLDDVRPTSSMEPRSATPTRPVRKRSIATSPIPELIERSSAAVLAELQSQARDNASQSKDEARPPSPIVPVRQTKAEDTPSNVSRRGSRRQSISADRSHDPDAHHSSSFTPKKPKSKASTRRHSRKTRFAPDPIAAAMEESLPEALTSQIGPPSEDDDEPSGRPPAPQAQSTAGDEDADAAFGRFRGLRTKSTAFDAPFIDPHSARPATPDAPAPAGPTPSAPAASPSASPRARRSTTDRQHVARTPSSRDRLDAAKRKVNLFKKHRPSSEERDRSSVSVTSESALDEAAPDPASIEMSMGTVATTADALTEATLQAFQLHQASVLERLTGALHALHDASAAALRPFTKEAVALLHARHLRASDAMDALLLEIPETDDEQQVRAEKYFRLFKERRDLKAAMDEASKATSALGLKEKETYLRKLAAARKRLEDLGNSFLVQGDLISYAELRCDVAESESAVARWLTADERDELLAEANANASSQLDSLLDSAVDEDAATQVLRKISGTVKFCPHSEVMGGIRSAACCIATTLADLRCELVDTADDPKPRVRTSIQSMGTGFAAAAQDLGRNVGDFIENYKARERRTKLELAKRAMDLRLFNQDIEFGFLKKLAAPDGYCELTPGSLSELYLLHHKHLKRLLRQLRDRSPLTNIKLVDGVLLERNYRIEMVDGEAKASVQQMNVPFLIAADTALVARFADYYNEETEGQFRIARSKFKKYCETLTLEAGMQTDAVRIASREHAGSMSASDVFHMDEQSPRGDTSGAVREAPPDAGARPTKSADPSAYQTVFGTRQLHNTTLGGAAVPTHLPPTGRLVFPGRKFAMGGKRSDAAKPNTPRVVSEAARTAARSTTSRATSRSATAQSTQLPPVQR